MKSRLGLLICGCLALALLLWKPWLSKKNPLPVNAAPVLKTEAAPSPLQKTVATPPGAQDISAHPNEKLTSYLLREHPAALETQIETRDPFIGRYRLLAHRKVLLTPDEKGELSGMLHDQEKLGAYQSYLNHVDFSAQEFASEQMYRLFLLQYIESALASVNDPQLLDFLCDFVVDDNFGSDLPGTVKKALAYEKIKVIGMLKLKHPEALAQIKARLSGLRHEKLLRQTLDG